MIGPPPNTHPSTDARLSLVVWSYSCPFLILLWGIFCPLELVNLNLLQIEPLLASFPDRWERGF